MAVNMAKGGNVSLTKLASESGFSLNEVVVACGWKAGRGLDLDISAIGLDASDRVPSNTINSDGEWRQEWLVWANMRSDSHGAIRFLHDNRRGGGKEEQLTIDVTKVPAHILKIRVQVVIWQARERGGQRFGDVKNSYIRIYDKRTGQELARFNLGADFSDETLVLFGELYRHGGEWKFRAMGEGYEAERFRSLHGIASPIEREFARYRH
ncbi:MAG TPA: TerD family protein [Candidatus Saccharimonadales bacterium]|nr:TerD family protein [Candidatus Saccharimonadales bacterium]